MSLPSHPVRRALYRLVTSLFASVSTILLSVYQCTLEFEVEGEDHLRLLKAKGENYVWQSGTHSWMRRSSASTIETS
ncbi:MAG TPA: hypothetical protein PKE49_15460 [Leptospiraceae bacterium]|nr:hypothetical protein [Leptospiraceae bacterium]